MKYKRGDTEEPIVQKDADWTGKALRHREICNDLTTLYRRKNHDYGDSFAISYREEGMAMPRIRIGDKFNRFKSLTRGNQAEVADESIRDTLMDLANYAIMTIIEIDMEKEKKIENDHE